MREKERREDRGRGMEKAKEREPVRQIDRQMDTTLDNFASTLTRYPLSKMYAKSPFPTFSI